MRDLAAALTRSGSEACPANVVALPGAASVPTLTGPVDLYLGDEVLDPRQTHRREPDPPRRRPRPGRALLPAGPRAPGPGRGPHLLGPGRRPRAPPRHRPRHPGSRPALHDPGPRARRRPALADVEEALVLEVATDGTVTDHPRRRAGRPGDAGAPAPRAGDRADRARGQLGATRSASAAFGCGGARLVQGVPARRADRPGHRRTPRAPGPSATRPAPTTWEPEPEPRPRAGPARAGRDHRAGRVAEPERIRARARLQPAAAAAPGRPAQRVQPAAGAAAARQDAVPAGDAAGARC